MFFQLITNAFIMITVILHEKCYRFFVFKKISLIQLSHDLVDLLCLKSNQLHLEVDCPFSVNNTPLKKMILVIVYSKMDRTKLYAVRAVSSERDIVHIHLLFLSHLLIWCLGISSLSFRKEKNKEGIEPKRDLLL
jgi:hypothetical protein